MNRRWVFSPPLPRPLCMEDFLRADAAVPVLRQGQALMRVRMISIDPANRLYPVMQAYRPRVMPGDVMAGFGIAEVVQSTDPRFRPGELWHGDFGWQDYAVLNSFDRAEYVHRCVDGRSIEENLGVLGITGLTAWFGLHDHCRPEPGDTVVVAGATGACGSLIAQLARDAGARVIGFAGGPEKCRWVETALGVAAVDYRAPDLPARLAALCPDGVQVFSDAVGGVVSAATLPQMRRGARWFHYGNLTAYDTLVPGQPVPRNDDGLTPALRAHCATEGLRPDFMLVFDHYGQRAKAQADLARRIDAGRLVAPLRITEGLDTLPAALFSPDDTQPGKRMVRLEAY